MTPSLATTPESGISATSPARRAKPDYSVDYATDFSATPSAPTSSPSPVPSAAAATAAPLALNASVGTPSLAPTARTTAHPSVASTVSPIDAPTGTPSGVVPNSVASAVTNSVTCAATTAGTSGATSAGTSVGTNASTSAGTSAVTEPAETLRETLFAAIGTDLQRVETRLREELRSDHPYVDELVRYGCLLGGKRLRPALLLLAAKACGGVREEHLTLATVVEMIHTATLVHDDVIDEAGMRRHLATVNARWDNEASVLLGDFLFTHAFYLASTLPTTHACRLIGHATNIVCEGELRQKGLRGRFDLNPAEYFAVVEAKTAELCSVSCELGAFYAGASPEIAEALSLYGRDLGIAFQIADDLLDFQGDEDTMGKSLGTDLQKQRPTLPVIHLLERASGGERTKALAALRGEVDNPLPVLRELLVRHGSFEHTLAVAANHAHRAVNRLNGLAPSVARDTLSDLAQFVVQRRR